MVCSREKLRTTQRIRFTVGSGCSDTGKACVGMDMDVSAGKEHEKDREGNIMIR